MVIGEAVNGCNVVNVAVETMLSGPGIARMHYDRALVVIRHAGI